MNDEAYYGRSRVICHVRAAMRDGVEVASTVFLPHGDGPFPTVLVRTAYNRANFDGRAFTDRGLAFVVQDCRGRYASDGELYPFVNEADDGWDTLQWLTAQPWCNGRVGMWGPSYLAAVQFALAPLGHPALAAMNPSFMAADIWRRGYYCDGAFSLALTFSWLCLEVGSRTSQASVLPQFNVPALLRSLPLGEMDERLGCGEVEAYRDYLSHEARDEAWQEFNWLEGLAKSQCPVLLTGGWYDYYPGQAVECFGALREAGGPLAASHRLILGPWTHGFTPTSKLGQLDFGPASMAENDSHIRWLECILKGRKAEEFQPAPVRLFVMGANRWRDEQEWPLKRTRYRRMYLASGGRANSLLGDGTLQDRPPAKQAIDGYTYNPENPVPTLGGNHSVGTYNPGLYELALPGPYDQRPVERRDDVLVYTSPPLEKDTEVTGPVTAKIFAASSAPDTDFVARLCDVHPDGRSINITEGVIRARFRHRQWDSPRPLRSGEIFEYTIELLPTSNLFKAGHCIRLDITSSNFPLWDRNLNLGEPIATATRMQSARQTILHDEEHPSHVVLPVIPAE